MGDILSLAKKLERAMRNRTGFNVTLDELDAMVEDDVVDGIYAAKLKRLKSQCHAKPALTLSETSGSTSVGMGSRPSGRSQPISPEAANTYISALGFGNAS
jgi:hypothetical protein